jgi:hypothetical protein
MADWPLLLVTDTLLKKFTDLHSMKLETERHLNVPFNTHLKLRKWDGMSEQTATIFFVTTYSNNFYDGYKIGCLQVMQEARYKLNLFIKLHSACEFHQIAQICSASRQESTSHVCSKTVAGRRNTSMSGGLH